MPRLRGKGSTAGPVPAADAETVEAADAVAPDYGLPENWAYYALGEDKAADLFLICPTVDMRDEYNMRMDDEKTRASFLGALNMERGIYEESTRMFAPYYRQAAMKVYSLTPEEWEPYMELAYRDISAALGVELAYVETSWPTLMEDTLAGKFDLAICGITVTEARQEQALMSIGYLENGKTVLCRAEDADKYTSLEAIDRPEVRVMENPGGLNEKFAREKLPHASLIIHDVNQEIPGLVASGEADVMITEIMEAGYYVGQDSRLAAPLIYEPFSHGQLGVLMPKGSEELLAYVNAFLEKEKASGRIDELAEEYIYRYIDQAELEPAA